MKVYNTFIALTTTVLFMFSSTITGQNYQNNSEFELALENTAPDAQVFLNINELENNLIIKLFDKDFTLSEQESILKLDSDNITITFDHFSIKNVVKTHLEPSTISHKKSYSIFIDAALTEGEVQQIINSKDTKISIASKQFNKEWIIKNSSFDKIKPLFTKTPTEELEIIDEDLPITDLTETDKNTYELEKGVLIKKINPDSPFYNSELEANSVIIQIDGIDIENTDQFNMLINEKKNTSSIFTVKTVSGEMKFIVINIP